MPSAPYRGLFNNPDLYLETSPGSVAGTSIALLWPMNTATAPQTCIPANSVRGGQRFKVTAYGIITTAASSQGNVTVTPIWGTTTGGISLGASAATALTASLSSAPWTLEMWLSVRARSFAATSTTVICGGRLILPTNVVVPFGSNGAVSVDTTTAQGLVAAVTLGSASDNMTTQDVFMESLN